MNKKVSPFKMVLAILLRIVIVILIAVVLFFAWLTIVEWKPADIEPASQIGTKFSRHYREGESIDVLSWNIGYAALGETEDFFMDGGTKVRPDSADVVRNNLSAIGSLLGSTDPDIVFFQEVDSSSKRSYKINEVEYLAGLGDRTAYYALNYSCPYVPYPFPVTLGKVNSGLLTLTNSPVDHAERYQLSLSYSWPVRMANLKRCLLVERVPVEGSGKELILVNMHLEAYAPLEAKEQQTYLLKKICMDEYEKGNYVIAGGDWNMTFPDVDPSLYPITETDNYVAEVMDPELCPEGWSFIFDQSVPTCRLLNKPYDKNDPNTQYYVIDGFLVSPNVNVQGVQTLDMGFVNSDHNPVAMTVVLGE